jgi:hypothetical protein
MGMPMNLKNVRPSSRRKIAPNKSNSSPMPEMRRMEGLGNEAAALVCCEWVRRGSNMRMSLRAPLQSKIPVRTIAIPTDCEPMLRERAKPQPAFDLSKAHLHTSQKTLQIALIALIYSDSAPAFLPFRFPVSAFRSHPAPFPPPLFAPFAPFCGHPIPLSGFRKTVGFGRIRSDSL